MKLPENVKPFTELPKERQKEIIRIVAKGISGKMTNGEFLAFCHFIAENHNRILALTYG